MSTNTPAQDRLLEELRTCETAVWAALREGDADADARLLHADFLGVYPDGFADRSDHVGQLDQGASIASFTLDDLRARPLGHTHAILTYRAVFQRRASGTPEIMYVSSVWQRDAGSWVNIFSQDTPAQT